MELMQKSLLSRVEAALREADLRDVCKRCRLRFAGVKDSRQHAAKEEVDDQEEVLNPPPAKRVKSDNGDHGDFGDTPDAPATVNPVAASESSPCRACLGVLQDRFMRAPLQKVVCGMKEGGFDADHFTVAVSLPVSLALRAHSLNVFLAEKVEGFDEDDVVPIKQVWKWLFPASVEKEAGRRYATGDACEFFVELDIKFEQDAEEIDKL